MCMYRCCIVSGLSLYSYVSLLAQVPCVCIVVVLYPDCLFTRTYLYWLRYHVYVSLLYCIRIVSLRVRISTGLGTMCMYRCCIVSGLSLYSYVSLLAQVPCVCIVVVLYPDCLFTRTYLYWLRYHVYVSLLYCIRIVSLRVRISTGLGTMCMYRCCIVSGLSLYAYVSLLAQVPCVCIVVVLYPDCLFTRTYLYWLRYHVYVSLLYSIRIVSLRVRISTGLGTMCMYRCCIVFGLSLYAYLSLLAYVPCVYIVVVLYQDCLFTRTYLYWLRYHVYVLLLHCIRIVSLRVRISTGLDTMCMYRCCIVFGLSLYAYVSLLAQIPCVCIVVVLYQDCLFTRTYLYWLRYHVYVSLLHCIRIVSLRVRISTGLDTMCMYRCCIVSGLSLYAYVSLLAQIPCVCIVVVLYSDCLFTRTYLYWLRYHVYVSLLYSIRIVSLRVRISTGLGTMCMYRCCIVSGLSLYAYVSLLAQIPCVCIVVVLYQDCLFTRTFLYWLRQHLYVSLLYSIRIVSLRVRISAGLGTMCMYRCCIVSGLSLYAYVSLLAQVPFVCIVVVQYPDCLFTRTYLCWLRYHVYVSLLYSIRIVSLRVRISTGLGTMCMYRCCIVSGLSLYAYVSLLAQVPCVCIVVVLYPDCLFTRTYLYWLRYHVYVSLLYCIRIVS